MVLWAYVLIRRLPNPISPRVWDAFLAMGVQNNVIPFSLTVWGQSHLPSGLVSILNGSNAVFGVLVAVSVFAAERLSARKLTGALLGMAGVIVVIGLSNLRRFDLTSLAQLTVLAASVPVLLRALVQGESLSPRALAGFGLPALGILVLDGRLIRVFKVRK